MPKERVRFKLLHLGEDIDAAFIKDLQRLMLDEAALVVPASALSAAKRVFLNKLNDIKGLAESVDGAGQRQRVLDIVDGFQSLL